MKRLLLLILTIQPAAAADMVLDAVSPREPDVRHALRVDGMEVTTTLRGWIAETQATLTLSTDADSAHRMEGLLDFTLPQGCTITGAALDIGDQLRAASFTSRLAAQEAYDAVVSTMLDPCLVQLLPQGRVKVRIFPIVSGKPRKLRLEFAQLVDPGGRWRLPFSLPSPVPARLHLDALPEARTSEAPSRGGKAWTARVPDGSGSPLPAHPDETGSWRFQVLLPPAKPMAAPRHLLVVADVSQPRAGRDTAVEHGFLTQILRRMPEGRVTLVPFSNVQHPHIEHEVVGGRCEAMLDALESLTCDGAPRPGAVDASAVPADLTVVLGSLTTPMGGSAWPMLPASAPVWIVDSAAPAPSAAARELAAETGGLALDPRQPAPPKPAAGTSISGEQVAGLQRHPMPGGATLLIGELTAEQGVIIVDGRRLTVFRGTDASAGRLTARLAARAAFARLMAAAEFRLPRDFQPDKTTQPFLTEDTAFIVLETAWQYLQHGIPLPPDLPAPGPLAEEQSRMAGMDCFDKALQRPAGTRGDDRPWSDRLLDISKQRQWETRRQRLWRFHALVAPDRVHADTAARRKLEGEPSWNAIKEGRERRSTELPRMARAFGAASEAERPALIEQARALQSTRVHDVRLIEPSFPYLYSAGDFDPLRPLELDLAHDGSGPWGAFGSAPADFLEEGALSSGWGPGFGTGSTAGQPKVPRWLETPVSKPVGAPPLSDAAAIITRADALLASGDRAAGLRALTCLSLHGRPGATPLFLLAWQLEEWNEPALAREVLEHIRRTFGHAEAVAWHLARLARAAGRSEEAVWLLQSVDSDPARRELAAIAGRRSSDLRVVLECADPGARAGLEIVGPDFELCSWDNPLPSFGGALSFDAEGLALKEFVLPAYPDFPLAVRVCRESPGIQPVRITVIRDWGRPSERRTTRIIPAAPRGITEVATLP